MREKYLLQTLDYADPENLGGASRAALSLSGELQNLGWKVLVFAGCKGQEGLRKHGGISFCHFSSLPSDERTLSADLGHVWRPQAVLKKYMPETVSLVGCHQPFVAWNVRKLLSSVPMVYFFHSPWPGEYAEAGTRKGRTFFIGFTLRVLFERWALKKAKVIFIASEFMRQRLFSYHGHDRFAGKIYKVPYGIKSDFFYPAGKKQNLRRSLGLPVDKRILITVRRLEDRMGIAELLKGFKCCSEKHPDLFLVIVGKGSLEKKLKALAENLGVSSTVLFWGYAEEKELPILYSASDLFVLPTQELEGFGLVILEALACDVPVVATAVGGIPDVMGELGRNYLTKGNDFKSIADKICDVLEKPDKILRRNYFREYALKNYSWRRYAESFIEKTKELI